MGTEKALIIGCCLSLAGCASNLQWVKPGATAADFQRDKLQCEYEAKVATPGRYSGRGMANAISDGLADGMRLNELGTLCMQTRGYSLVTAGSPAAMVANAAAPPPEPAPRRNLKPAAAIAEARKHISGSTFTGLRYATVTSAMGDPTDVVCGSVDSKPFVYFVDQREATVVAGPEADVNRGIHRSFCERSVAQR